MRVGFCGAAVVLALLGGGCGSETASPVDDGAIGSGDAAVVGGGNDAGGELPKDGGGPGATDGSPPLQSGSGVFPSTSTIYQDISKASVDSAWPTIRAAVDALGGWGTTKKKIAINFEIHVLSADAAVGRRVFTQDPDNFYDGECDTAPIPIPVGGAIEGQDDYACDTANGDCHLIVVQGTRLYEGYKSNITGGTATGSPFSSGCLAIWDLTKDYWKPVSAGAVFSRGDHCSSADAGGFPIAALLFSADEVASGEIKHAIRFILPNDRIRSDVYVHPATHAAGAGAADVLPYGARLRLKATANLAGLKPWAVVVAHAMQKYGMFLSDGGNIALTAADDRFTTAKWTDANVNVGPKALSAIQVSDFDIVNLGTIITTGDNCIRNP
jgi:hypothetical protein